MMASSEIIPNSNQADHNSKSRQAEFEVLSSELVERELELATLENELSVFEKRYNGTVGILFAELDQLDKEIAKELFRLHPEEKYKRDFQDAERKAQASQGVVNEKFDLDEKKAFIPSEDVRELFRKVAKAVHPDYATNETERAYCTLLMTRANAAYKNGDKEALEKILFEWEHRDKRRMLDEIQPNELNQLEVKIRQIKIRLAEIETRILELKESELYQLMLKVEQVEQRGRDLLADMANDLRQQIQVAKVRLNDLKQQGK